MKFVGPKAISLLTLAVLAGVFWYGTGKTPEELPLEERIDQRKARHDTRYEHLQELDDQDLAQYLWEREKDSFYRGLEALSFDFEPSENTYSPSRLKPLEDYSTPSAMADAFLDSLVAMAVSNYAACTRYSDYSFVLGEGFAFPFAHRLTLNTLSLNNGETLDVPDLMTRGEMQTRDVIRRGNVYCAPAIGREEAAQPATLAAEFHAELPDKLLEFELDADDVGTSQEKEGYHVTLLEMSDYSYVVEVTTDARQGTIVRSQDIIAEAWAANGRPIKLHATEDVRMESHRRMESLLDTLIDKAEKGDLTEAEAAQALDDLKQRNAQESASPVYRAFAFKGPVNTARITILAGGESRKTVSRQLQLPVHFFASTTLDDNAGLSALPEIEETLPVYNNRREIRARAMDLRAAAMREDIEISQREVRGPWADHPKGVFLHYPTVQSDLFIGAFDRYGVPDADDVAFFDKEGNPLSVADGEDDAFLFTADRLEYDPARFTAPPARLKASVPVLTAPDIEKTGYAKTDLPNGIRLESNRLIVDYAEFTPQEAEYMNERTARKRSNWIFATDANGYLEEINMRRFHRPEGEPVEVYYFYGHPTGIEIWYPGPTKFVDYTFDIELAQKTE